MKIRLIVSLNKELMGLSFVEQKEITIGRDTANVLAPLTAEGLSRRHARLFHEDGKWFVEDLGSTNGSYKMGAKIEGREELNVRDVLQFGKLEVCIESLGESAPSAAAPATTVRTAKTLSMPRPASPINPVVDKKAPPAAPNPAAPGSVKMEPVADLTPVEEVKDIPAAEKTGGSKDTAAAETTPASHSPLSPISPVRKPVLKPGLKLPPRKPVSGAGLKLPPRPVLKPVLKKPVLSAK